MVYGTTQSHALCASLLTSFWLLSFNIIRQNVLFSNTKRFMIEQQLIMAFDERLIGKGNEQRVLQPLA